MMMMIVMVGFGSIFLFSFISFSIRDRRTPTMNASNCQNEWTETVEVVVVVVVAAVVDGRS